jgi:hypothetical protein
LRRSCLVAFGSYAGVVGPGLDLGITFPSSALTDYGMTVGLSDIYLGGTAKVFSFSKAGKVTALEFGAAQGLTTTHLGYDLAFGGGSLFSVDSTTTTNASRLFRIFDGATWGPTPWDLSPLYPATSPFHTITYDGSVLLMATRRTTTSAAFYSFPVSASAAPTLLGTSTAVWYVVGIAADDQSIYVAGNGTQGEGVYRLSRSNIAAAPVKIATLDVDTLAAAIEVDADVAPANLYVRDALGDVHAVVQPGGPGAAHIGAISTLGTTNDYAMAFDKGTGRLYLFETETDSSGVIRELQ